MKMFAWTALAGSLLVSCSPYQYNDYGDFDATEKSMIVPAGNDRPLSALKRELTRHGWKLRSSHNGSSVYELGARYKMSLSYGPSDMGLRKFDVFVSDNRTGREIMSARGEDTSHGFMKKLAADIASHTH